MGANSPPVTICTPMIAGDASIKSCPEGKIVTKFVNKTQKRRYKVPISFKKCWYGEKTLKVDFWERLSTKKLDFDKIQYLL